MVNLRRPVRVHRGDDPRCVIQVDLHHRDAINDGVEVRMKHRAAGPLHTEHVNAPFRKELGEVGAILTADTCD